MHARAAVLALVSLAWVAAGCDFEQPERFVNEAAVPPVVAPLVFEDMEEGMRLVGDVELCVSPERYDFEISGLTLNLIQEGESQPFIGLGATPPCVRFSTFSFEGGSYGLQVELRSREPVNGLLSFTGVPAVTLAGTAIFDNRPPAQPQVQVEMEGVVPTLTWTYAGDPPPLVLEHVVERRVRSDRYTTDYEVVAMLGDEQRFVDTTLDPIIATELDYRVRALNGIDGGTVGEASAAVGMVVAGDLGGVRQVSDPVSGETLLLSRRPGGTTGEIVVLGPDATVVRRVQVARPMDTGIVTADGRLFVLTEARQRLEEWSRTTFEPLRDVTRFDAPIGAFDGAFVADAAGRLYAAVDENDPNLGQDVVQIDPDTGERIRLNVPPTDDGFPTNVGLLADRERLYVVDSGFGFSKTRGRILVYDVSGDTPRLVDARRDPDSFNGVVLAEDGATLLLGQQPGRERARWVERWDAQTLQTLSRYEVVAQDGDEAFFFFAAAGSEPLLGFETEVVGDRGLLEVFTRYRRLDPATGQLGPPTLRSRRGSIVDLGPVGVLSVIGDLNSTGASRLWLLPQE